MRLNATMTLKEMADRLKKETRCYVVRHKSPDGDAIGSQFGLVLGLRQLGIDAQPLHTDAVPAAYHYMTDAVPVHELEDAVYIAVDTASPARLGRYAETPMTYCIDHHEKDSVEAPFKYVEEDAASCSQIIFKLLREMGAEVDAQIAGFLYAGLLTDTNSFRSFSTNQDALMLAAQIAGCGIDPSVIARRHCFYKSEKRLAIEGCLMSTLRRSEDGQLLSCMVTWDDMQRVGIQDNEMEGLNSVVEQVEGARLAVVLREKAPQVCRFSIRAAKGLNAAEVCAVFGGGGHASAAGCDLTGTPEACMPKVLAACEAYLAAHSDT